MRSAFLRTLFAFSFIVFSGAAFADKASFDARGGKDHDASKSDRPDRADRSDKPDRADRTDHSDKTGRADRPDRSDKTERAERTERTERADRNDRDRSQDRHDVDRSRSGPERHERADRTDAKQDFNRADRRNDTDRTQQRQDRFDRRRDDTTASIDRRRDTPDARQDFERRDRFPRESGDRHRGQEWGYDRHHHEWRERYNQHNLFSRTDPEERQGYVSPRGREAAYLRRLILTNEDEIAYAYRQLAIAQSRSSRRQLQNFIAARISQNARLRGRIDQLDG